MSVKVNVISTPKNRVSVNTRQRTEVRSVGITPKIVDKLRELEDVNATNLNNNNTIVYDSASDTFVVKELPIINGGTF